MRRALNVVFGVSLVAAICGIGVAQQTGRNDPKTPAALPGIDSVAIEQDARAGTTLLLVHAIKGPAHPGSFPYAFDTGDVIVNDLGRDGDRRAGDGTYTAKVRFDVDELGRTATANFAKVQAEPLTAPAIRSLRFDPPTRKLQGGAKLLTAPQLRTQQLTADRLFRTQSVTDSKAALATFKLPAARRPAEVLRFDRAKGDVRATLFGRQVPVGILTLPKLKLKVLPSAVKPERSLMITAPEVVKDTTRTFEPCTTVPNQGNPNGVWTFKHLMTEMANTPQTGIAPEDFVFNWLTQQNSAQPVNSFSAGARPGFVSMVRDRWLTQSGGVKLNLDKAPFRLLAIVSRTDLGTGVSGYSGGNAGEARFVFGVLDPNNACGVQQSTVIFEYAIQKSSCAAKKAWIQDWFSLSGSGFVLGGSFNTKLQTLTESFVTAGANPAQLPNRSAIGQVRTNDLIAGPWMLFEFQPRSAGDPDPGALHNVTVKQNPDISFKNAPGPRALLAQFIGDNQAALLNGTYVIPAVLPAPSNAPILGGESPTFNNTSFTWTDTSFATPVDPAALAAFSIGTCNGCHTGDTGTAFTHVKPRTPAGVASLSTFLNNPGDPAEDDLERRQRMMANALNGQCFALPLTATLPFGFVH
ncbi:hypothetical protein P6144_13075 [Sphingomonas sp. HITSZ_GF]|uniref:hypothetical protein n=1 Tax=Sphingomonas sp. HITSZ_GF TaxID=3037247 RepID=UPI00240D21FB|nr:hypothetical protein [Sphingomonas sp. HITSZ_GF]MDG2534587.1 hypothetical protein [Sphingomonas sp. HITSZ_GF]